MNNATTKIVATAATTGAASLRVATCSVLSAILLVLLPAPNAHAERETAKRVEISQSRFPTVDAVARIFPDYRGGRREFLGQRQMQVTAEDCLYIDAAAIQPRAGKTAVYSDRNGQSPYFRGGTNPVVSMWDFRKPKRARDALDEQRDAIDACYGRHSEPGYSATITSVDAPTFAQDSFTYRTVTGDSNTGRDWTIYTYSRQGRFLTLTFLQRDRGAPSSAAAFALTRTSLRAAS